MISFYNEHSFTNGDKGSLNIAFLPYNLLLLSLLGLINNGGDCAQDFERKIDNL